jgi:hypothetical protein
MQNLKQLIIIFIHAFIEKSNNQILIQKYCLRNIRKS